MPELNDDNDAISVPFEFLIPPDSISFGEKAMMINNREFIIIPKHCTDDISKYNIIESEWSYLSLKNNPNSNINLGTACVDRKTQILYILSAHRRNLMKIDLNSGAPEAIKFEDAEAKRAFQRIRNGEAGGVMTTGHFADKASSIFVQNKLHIVGGVNNPDHLIWSNHNKEYIINHNFEEEEDCDQYRLCSGLIYLKSKQSLLYFGGICWKTMYSYSIESNTWTKMKEEIPKSVRNWRSRNIICRGDQYIVMLDQDVICLFDWMRHVFKKFAYGLSTDEDGICYYYHAVLMSDDKKEEMITSGYIREHFKSQRLIFAKDLSKLLSSFYVDEYLYLIGKIKEELIHFRINFDFVVQHSIDIVEFDAI